MSWVLGRAIFKLLIELGIGQVIFKLLIELGIGQGYI